jgi:hypothetical protein
MLKRIMGVVAAVAGLLVTVTAAVRLAYAIPSNFTTNGKGLDMLVDLVERYSLWDHIPAVLVGMTVTLSALPLLLSPRKKRVATVASAPERDGEPPLAEAPEISLPSDVGAQTPSAEVVTRILRTRLRGATFRNPDGVSRRVLLAGIAAGDILLCRSSDRKTPDEGIGVYTLRGEQLGYLDTGFIRDLRAQYPGFRIGITVEKVIGGRQPHTCLLRVAVYGA